MADKPSSKEHLSQILTPVFLQELRTFWFHGSDEPETLVLPSQTAMMRYFIKDAEFDEACVARYQPVLEAIKSSNASPDDILSAAAATTSSSSSPAPLDWLSLIILFDQIPRNCYRGPDSSTAFRTFDPLAQDLSMRAFREGIPSRSPELRHRLFYRFWFLLPLMHSEDLSVHEFAVGEHEKMARDIGEFVAKADPVSASGSGSGSGSGSTGHDDEKFCHAVLSGNPDAAKQFLDNVLQYETRHKVIIERFGRYPHRNHAMGRKSTEEEVEYLNSGGETFG